jgi:hypothetical protein
MRKLALGWCLLLAVIVTAAGSAIAEGSSGTCKIHGTATFGAPHLQALPAQLGYEFSGSANCEFLPGRELLKGIVEAHGQEALSCAGSLGESEGKGTLTLAGTKFPFGLTFVAGMPGSTGLIAKFENGAVAVGSAGFLLSAADPAADCFLVGGAAKLEFDAVAAGEL